MFKKKSIYIIGIVIFTLILIADLMLYFFSPIGFDRGDIGGFGGGKPGGGFASGNSGFDSLDGTDTDDGGNSDFGSFGGGGLNNKGDFGGMRPDGENGDFTMPEGMEVPEDKELPEGMEIPEGLDASAKPGKGQIGGAMTIFSTIRNLFWPVLIVCILGDGLCIFMLIRISRKKKAAALQAQAASANLQEQSPMTGKDE